MNHNTRLGMEIGEEPGDSEAAPDGAKAYSDTFKQGSEGLAHKIVLKNTILTACFIDFGLTTTGLIGILPANIEY